MPGKSKSRTNKKKSTKAKGKGKAKSGALFDPLGLSNLDSLMYANPVYGNFDPGYVLRKTAVYTPAAPRMMPLQYNDPENKVGESLYAPTINQTAFNMQGGGMDIITDSSMMASMNPAFYGPMMNMYPGMGSAMSNIYSNPLMRFASDFEHQDKVNVVRNNTGELPQNLMEVQSRIEKPGYPGFVPPPQRLATVSSIQL